jgi:hypothetical protein
VMRDGDVDLNRNVYTRRSNTGTMWADRFPDGSEPTKSIAKDRWGAALPRPGMCSCAMGTSTRHRLAQGQSHCVVCGRTIPGLAPPVAPAAAGSGLTISDADIERIAAAVLEKLGGTS